MRDVIGVKNEWIQDATCYDGAGHGGGENRHKKQIDVLKVSKYELELTIIRKKGSGGQLVFVVIISLCSLSLGRILIILIELV